MTRMHLCLCVLLIVRGVAAISQISFDSVSYSFPDTGSAVFGVLRRGTAADAQYSASVQYAMVDDTACAGVGNKNTSQFFVCIVSLADYTSSANVLHWAAGDLSPKYVEVALNRINRSSTDFGTKYFTVELANVTGGAVIALPSAAPIYITSTSPIPITSSSAGTLSSTGDRSALFAFLSIYTRAFCSSGSTGSPPDLSSYA